MENHLVRIIAESDDFDGVTAYGIAHRDFDRVAQVLIPDEEGWWEGRFIPFLLFYRGERPGKEAQFRLVCEAIENEGYEFQSVDTSFVNMTATKAPYKKVQVTDQSSFEEMAKHGMFYGRKYRHVRYQQECEEIYLVFYNDENELPIFQTNDVIFP